MRRECLLGMAGMAGAALLRGQQPGEFTTPDGDTFIRIMGAEDGDFLVGVRTSVKADLALVDVFYEEDHPQFGKLLLSKSSTAPVPGLDAYGATHDNFSIPRDRLKLVRITFLNEVTRREATIR